MTPEQMAKLLVRELESNSTDPGGGYIDDSDLAMALIDGHYNLASVAKALLRFVEAKPGVLYVDGLPVAASSEAGLIKGTRE